MWDCSFRKASATTLKDKSSSESLSQGQFLAFERPDMIFYTTSNQENPLTAPKLPDSYFNTARVKTLSASISVPAKQDLIQETVCRENVEISGHVLWFKMVIEELNNRIQELASEIRNSGDLDTVREYANLIVKYLQPQASIIASVGITLDTVLKQNMLLAGRDNLLKDCSSKLGPKDLANLHRGYFDQQEVFDSDILSRVDHDQRLSIIKDSDTKSCRDTSRTFDFERSSHSKSS